MSMLSLISPRERFNIIIAADSYKDSHYLMIPSNVHNMNFYIEPRGGVYKKVCVAGLQMFCKMFLKKPIDQEDIDEAEAFSLAQNGNFNREGWEHILKKYKGKLPVIIRAVPEGTIMPVSLPMISVRLKKNDKKLAWLPGYLETLLQRYMWVASTIATNTMYCKEIIRKHVEQTVDDTNIASVMGFMLNDFGARGTMDPIFTGLGHLFHFIGSDNKEAIYATNFAYNCAMTAFSIAASEHSIMTIRGRSGEFAQMEFIIDTFGAKGRMFAMVLDSYDMDEAITFLTSTRIKEKLFAYGEHGAKFVGRPDSGIPQEVLPHVNKRFLNGFGYTTNSKGYDCLPACIGTIQGDAVEHDTLDPIMAACTAQKISAQNYCFGSGGGLLQKFNRDTMKFAMKNSATYDEEIGWYGVQKNPATAAWKASKAGLVGTYYVHGAADPIFMTEDQVNALSPEQKSHVVDAMITFYDGENIIVDETLDNIRGRIENYLQFNTI